MPFIPHTEDEVAAMLDAIGVSDIADLFDEIPQSLRIGKLNAVPDALSEMEVGRLMTQRAEQDGHQLNFIGAGAYEHHIPAAVWEITTRGEFYSAYTPYQAEASQGTLQVIYEYQTMMTRLMAMDVSNASLYDGASGLAEAVLMAVRANRKSKSKKILVPRALHPNYRKTTHCIVHNQGIELIEVPYDAEGGHTPVDALKEYEGQDITAVVIAQPNFFGVLEDVDDLTNWAQNNGALAIAVVNPLAMSVLKPPGQWGDNGVDIACGEGQPLGVPLSSGGPYYGFMCAKQAHVRQMPGRIVGRTIDRDNRVGYTLTLQAREQHIRRTKATSNICTNQGLAVTASTIFMSIVGGAGLQRMASQSHANTVSLVNKLSDAAVKPRFNRPYFHECALAMDMPLDAVTQDLADHKLLAGFALQDDYPELENCLLVCATETKTEQDLALFAEQLQRAIAAHADAGVLPQSQMV